MKRKPYVLIVDDEPKFVNILEAILQASGYQVHSTSTGETALKIVEREIFSLILLDVRLPDLNGFEICRLIRQFCKMPIIMITSASEKADIARGLNTGADDYLTKPFSADELLARIQAVLRRTNGHGAFPSEEKFHSNGLCVDYVNSRVFVGGEEARLTPIEYRLLCELTSAAGRVVSTRTILENVWGPGHNGDNQLIQRAMNRLRAKIEPNADEPRFIITRPGLGYMIEKKA